MFEFFLMTWKNGLILSKLKNPGFIRVQEAGILTWYTSVIIVTHILIGRGRGRGTLYTEMEFGTLNQNA